MHANRVLALQRVALLNDAAETSELGPWFLLDAATPEMPVFSQAAVTGSSAAATDLATAERWYADRGSAFRLALRDDVDAALIEAALQAGYRTDYVEPALFLALGEASPGPPAQLIVKEVSSEADLQTYGRLGWQRDGLEHIGISIARRAKELGFVMLLGLVGAEAVGSSMAVITGSLVGIYNVSVEPPYRRRGFGEAMVWAAAEAGRRRGATTSWLGSTQMSHALYQRMGFRQLYQYKLLVRGTDSCSWMTAAASAP
jgi:GNAT superfamily N-acetyltransferase